MAIFDIKFERHFDIYDVDLEEINNRVSKGEDFDFVFDEVIAKYDNQIYYNRKVFQEQVREYIKELSPTDIYNVHIAYTGLTKNEVEKLKNEIKDKHPISSYEFGYPVLISVDSE